MKIIKLFILVLLCTLISSPVAAKAPDVSFVQAVNIGNEKAVKYYLKHKESPTQTDENGVPLLSLAAQKGYTSIMARLIKEGCSVNITDKQSFTPLMHAAMANQPAAVSALLKANADPNVRTTDAAGFTLADQDALMLISYKGDFPEIARLLINGGANVNKPNKGGGTPLRTASWFGRNETVKLLLKAKAEVNVPEDSDTMPPLQVALLQDQLETAKILIDAGADVNYTDKDGNSLLLWAVDNIFENADRTPFIALLAQKGVKVNHSNNIGETALIRVSEWDVDAQNTLALLDAGANVNAKTDANSGKQTPLSNAVKLGSMDLINVLLQAGADVNANNHTAYTNPLLQAIIDGREEVAQTLLLAGADPNTTNDKGTSALIVASFSGLQDTALTLIAAGADPNAADQQGRTALIYAAGKGNPEIVKLLLAAGAKVNAADKDNLNALMNAATNGNTEVVNLLLKAGSEKNRLKQDAWSALMLASYHGHTDVVKALISARASVNLASKADGWTALMSAAANGHTEIIKLLLKAGAQVNARNKTGASALMVAAAYGHTDAVKALLKAGANVTYKDNNKKSALDYTKTNDNAELTALLKKAGAK